MAEWIRRCAWALSYPREARVRIRAPPVLVGHNVHCDLSCNVESLDISLHHRSSTIRYYPEPDVIFNSYCDLRIHQHPNNVYNILHHAVLYICITNLWSYVELMGVLCSQYRMCQLYLELCYLKKCKRHHTAQKYNIIAKDVHKKAKKCC